MSLGEGINIQKYPGIISTTYWTFIISSSVHVCKSTGNISTCHVTTIFFKVAIFNLKITLQKLVEVQSATPTTRGTQFQHLSWVKTLVFFLLSGSIGGACMGRGWKEAAGALICGDDRSF